MGLNKSKENMYPWISHTWNTIKGKCPHGCAYCYMKKWGEQPTLHFDESELKTDLGTGNFIFVGSSCDMWADDIVSGWIILTMKHCADHHNNKYFFQSKNPGRFEGFAHWFNGRETFATTIETDLWVGRIMRNSPPPLERYHKIHEVRKFLGCPVVVTIEPIIDFTLSRMVSWIETIMPEWVNIGANTNHKVKLPEPSPEKLKSLIEELKRITDVKLKKNLNRLLK